MVQYLELCAVTAESPGWIPGQELRSHKLCDMAIYIYYVCSKIKNKEVSST